MELEKKNKDWISCIKKKIEAENLKTKDKQKG
jgi:hypothetical protein